MHQVNQTSSLMSKGFRFGFSVDVLCVGDHDDIPVVKLTDSVTDKSVEISLHGRSDNGYVIGFNHKTYPQNIWVTSWLKRVRGA